MRDRRREFFLTKRLEHVRGDKQPRANRADDGDDRKRVFRTKVGTRIPFSSIRLRRGQPVLQAANAWPAMNANLARCGEPDADRGKRRQRSEFPTYKFVSAVRLVSEIRRDHESRDRHNRDDWRPDAHHEKYFSARACRTFPEQRFAQTPEPCRDHRRSRIDGQQ